MKLFDELVDHYTTTTTTTTTVTPADKEATNILMNLLIKVWLKANQSYILDPYLILVPMMD